MTDTNRELLKPEIELSDGEKTYSCLANVKFMMAIEKEFNRSYQSVVADAEESKLRLDDYVKIIRHGIGCGEGYNSTPSDDIILDGIIENHGLMVLSLTLSKFMCLPLYDPGNRDVAVKEVAEMAKSPEKTMAIVLEQRELVSTILNSLSENGAGSL